MSHRYRDVSIPTWMWFFLALPLGIAFAWLWQRRQGKFLALRRIAPLRSLRYIEPDSIAIDTRPNYDMSEMEEAYHTDHAFSISQASMESTEFAEKHTGVGQESEAIVDDLKVIEGIGPKISLLLINNGITSYQELASTSIDRLDGILTGAKLRRLANPGTWPEQARLAATGDWDGLTQLQETLKGGRRKG